MLLARYSVPCNIVSFARSILIKLFKGSNTCVSWMKQHRLSLSTVSFQFLFDRFFLEVSPQKTETNTVTLSAFLEVSHQKTGEQFLFSF